MKKLELIVKKVELEKNSFYAYTHLDPKTNKWYKVKFVNECKPPKRYSIEEKVVRAYIGLHQDESDFNVTSKERVFNGKKIVDNIIYVSDFVELSEEEVKEMVKESKEKVKKYREKQEKNKKDFCETGDIDIM